MNEFNVIDRYFKKLAKNNPGALNLSDDVFFDKKNKIVISIDTYIEKVHFFLTSNPKFILKKIIRSSISDLLAKGVKPSNIFISASGNNKSLSKNKLNLISKSLSQEQKKFSFKLSGGDMTNSSKLSFTVTCLGFSKNIVKRNCAELNDDIYVTGNIGDSYVGLNILKNKLNLNSTQKKYFIKSYYSPNLAFDFCKHLDKFANTSIDISDGLLADMHQLIKQQNLSFSIYVDKIPISKMLQSYLKKYSKPKTQFIFNGDDYQILFTAPRKKRDFIKRISSKLNQKVTLIGHINNSHKKNIVIFNDKPLKISKFKGYFHKF